MTQHPTPIPPPSTGPPKPSEPTSPPVTRAGLQREQAIRADAAGIAATMLGDCAGRRTRRGEQRDSAGHPRHSDRRGPES